MGMTVIWLSFPCEFIACIDLYVAVAVKCDKLKAQPNGKLRCQDPFEKFSYNSTCMSECDSGFTIKGSTSTRCSLQGQWTKPLPVCQGKETFTQQWKASIISLSVQNYLVGHHCIHWSNLSHLSIYYIGTLTVVTTPGFLCLYFAFSYFSCGVSRGVWCTQWRNCELQPPHCSPQLHLHMWIQV